MEGENPTLMSILYCVLFLVGIALLTFLVFWAMKRDSSRFFQRTFPWYNKCVGGFSSSSEDAEDDFPPVTVYCCKRSRRDLR